MTTIQKRIAWCSSALRKPIYDQNVHGEYYIFLWILIEGCLYIEMKKKRRKFEVNIDTFWKRKEELESSTQCLSEGKEKSEQVFSNEDLLKRKRKAESFR